VKFQLAPRLWRPAPANFPIVASLFEHVVVIGRRSNDNAKHVYKTLVMPGLFDVDLDCRRTRTASGAGRTVTIAAVNRRGGRQWSTSRHPLSILTRCRGRSARDDEPAPFQFFKTRSA
jgi:hypothetical protein